MIQNVTDLPIRILRKIFISRIINALLWSAWKTILISTLLLFLFYKFPSFHNLLNAFQWTSILISIFLFFFFINFYIRYPRIKILEKIRKFSPKDEVTIKTLLQSQKLQGSIKNEFVSRIDRSSVDHAIRKTIPARNFLISFHFLIALLVLTFTTEERITENPPAFLSIELLDPISKTLKTGQALTVAVNHKHLPENTATTLEIRSLTGDFLLIHPYSLKKEKETYEIPFSELNTNERLILQAKVSEELKSNTLYLQYKIPLLGFEKRADIYGFEDLLKQIKWMADKQQNTLEKSQQLRIHRIHPDSFPFNELSFESILEDQTRLRNKANQAKKEFTKKIDDFFPNDFWQHLKKAQDEMNHALVSLELKNWAKAIPHQELSLRYLTEMLIRFQSKLQNLSRGSTEVDKNPIIHSIYQIQNKKNFLSTVIEEQQFINNRLQFINSKFHEWNSEEYKKELQSLRKDQLKLIDLTEIQFKKAPARSDSNQVLENTIFIMKQFLKYLSKANLPTTQILIPTPIPKEAEDLLISLKQGFNEIQKDELSILANNLYEMIEYISEYLFLSISSRNEEIHSQFSNRLLLYADIIEIIIPQIKDPFLKVEIPKLKDHLLFQFRSYNGGYRDSAEVQKLLYQLSKCYRLTRGFKDYLLEIKITIEELKKNSFYFLNNPNILEPDSQNSFFLWLDHIMKRQSMILEQIRVIGSSHVGFSQLNSAFSDINYLLNDPNKKEVNIKKKVLSLHKAFERNLFYLESIFNNQLRSNNS